MHVEVPSLGPTTVHVWKFDLAAPMDAGVEEDAPRTLDVHERERLGRLVFATDRVRYRRSHLWLRCVLGAYLGLDPASVPLIRDAQQKPGLDGIRDLSFNLSHSGDVALLAISRLAHLGVDVEIFGGHRDLHVTANGVYTPAELQELSCVEPTEYERAFLTLWTRKEAVLKAMGVGLMLHPAELHVGLQLADDTGTIRVTVPRGEYGDAIEVADVRAGDDCLAAVAIPSGWHDLTVVTPGALQIRN